MVSFEQIDAARAASGITRKALYEAAGVHKETWRRLAQQRNEPNTATLKKLQAALHELTNAEAA